MILRQNPRDLGFARRMRVYKRDLGASGKEVQCVVEEIHSDMVIALVDWEVSNVPANLNPNIRLETIEARAGSSSRSSGSWMGDECINR